MEKEKRRVNAALKNGNGKMFCNNSCNNKASLEVRVAGKRKAALNPKKKFEDHLDPEEVKNPNGCWNWIGGMSHGYGVFWDSTKHKKFEAHRYAWLRANNWTMPKDKPFVCHTCDVRSCVNTLHLYAGSHDDNMRDMKNRRRSTHGDLNYSAKLTIDQVKEIRNKSTFGISRSALAKEYGVSYSTVDGIIKRRTWKHIDEPTNLDIELD